MHPWIVTKNNNGSQSIVSEIMPTGAINHKNKKASIKKEKVEEKGTAADRAT